MNYDKYLVTGAKDPVGRLVVQLLLSEGCQVRVLVPPESDSSLLRGMGAEIAEGEIFDKDSLKDFMSVEDPRKSAVIHTEEILSISNNKNLNMRRVNVAGAQNVIDMALRAKIGRFVYLGSAYSLDPDTPMSGETIHFDRRQAEGDYASTKAEASEYLMSKISLNKFNASLLLPTFIIGPGFSEDYDMNRILKKYLENRVSTVAGGHAFVDVRNVATALVAVCENGEPGGAYILNGEYKSSQDFFAEVSETSGSERGKEMPKWAQSKSMSKIVDTFYRVTKKDNPKEVYALFMNSPEKNYESTVEGILPESAVRKVHDSLVDVLSRPGNEVLPDRIPNLEKMAEEAKAEAKAKPAHEKPVKEVVTVSEAVMKRAEESAARAAQSGEDAEKRAAAAAAARERVRAKIEAAKMKAELESDPERAQIDAKNSAAAEASSAALAAAVKAENEKEESGSTFMKGISVAEMLAEAEAKRKAEKESAASASSEAVSEPEVKEESKDEKIKAEEPAVEEKKEETLEAPARKSPFAMRDTAPLAKPDEKSFDVDDIPDIEEKEAEEAEISVTEESAKSSSVEQVAEPASQEAAEEITEKAEETVEEAAQEVEEATEDVVEATEEATAEATEETAESVEEAVEATEDTIEEKAEIVEEKAEDIIEEAPKKPLWEQLPTEETEPIDEPAPSADPEPEIEEVSEPESEVEEAKTSEPEASEESSTPADSSNKPLWERISADDITEEEIFGGDQF